MQPAKRIVYLACPYTHSERRVREERFRIATEVAAELIKQGHVVFSPITMTHPIDTFLAGEASTLGTEFWIAFDEAFMDFCAEIYVIKADGWDQSSGVQREIAYFQQCGKPVRFISANGANCQPEFR